MLKLLIIVVGSLLFIILPRMHGRMGEALLASTALRVLPDARVFRNLLLPTEKGTTEIDVLVVSCKGLYAIESKNYSGAIYGHFRARNWTQYTKCGKYAFYNPLRQNYGHVKTVTELLSCSESVIRDVVVFHEKCKLKVEHKKL